MEKLFESLRPLLEEDKNRRGGDIRYIDNSSLDVNSRPKVKLANGSCSSNQALMTDREKSRKPAGNPNNRNSVGVINRYNPFADLLGNKH